MTDRGKQAKLPQNMGLDGKSDPYISKGVANNGITFSEQRKKPLRMNSQQNKRSNERAKGSAPGAPPTVATEGHGRPLTKHQQRTRISNSQGGIRKRPLKQPFSANNNASTAINSQPQIGSFS